MPSQEQFSKHVLRVVSVSFRFVYVSFSFEVRSNLEVPGPARHLLWSRGHEHVHMLAVVGKSDNILDPRDSGTPLAVFVACHLTSGYVSTKMFTFRYV